MVLLVGGRVVQAEQRVKLLQAFLRGRATHFLRLIQDDDRAVCFDDVDRSAAAKIIQLCTDTPCIFTTSIECLNIDDHDVDICALAIIINIRQILGVVNEETSFLAIILHEVLLHGFKALLNAFTDCDTWNHYDELAPAIQLIQFKHSLDVNIGFTGTGFHFNIKRAHTQSSGFQRIRELDVIAGLDATDIYQKLPVIELHLGIGKAHVQFFIRKHPVCHISPDFNIAAVGEVVVERLTGKYTYHAVHSLGLVRLYGKFEFHLSHYSTFLCVLGL